MSAHTCHARRCEIAVPPALLMCSKHWRLVPPGLKNAVWQHYRRGQEVDKNPTEAYLVAAQAAVDAVFAAEGGVSATVRR